MTNSKAFSFAEILIATLCLSLALIPVTYMFSFSSTGTVQNRDQILARQHAANLMDYSFSLPYDDEFLKCGEKEIDFITFSAGSNDIIMEMEPKFSRKIKIEEVKSASWKYAYKFLSVEVSWEEAPNRNKTFYLTGMITKTNG